MGRAASARISPSAWRAQTRTECEGSPAAASRTGIACASPIPSEGDEHRRLLPDRGLVQAFDDRVDCFSVAETAGDQCRRHAHSAGGVVQERSDDLSESGLVERPQPQDCFSADPVVGIGEEPAKTVGGRIASDSSQRGGDTPSHRDIRIADALRQRLPRIRRTEKTERPRRMLADDGDGIHQQRLDPNVALDVADPPSASAALARTDASGSERLTSRAPRPRGSFSIPSAIAAVCRIDGERVRECGEEHLRIGCPGHPRPADATRPADWPGIGARRRGGRATFSSESGCAIWLWTDF